MPSLRKLLKTASNTSSVLSENKENASDLSPKSLNGNSSPKNDSLEAQLERKTKECQTARGLIEVMKQSRAKDEATITELKASIAQSEEVSTGRIRGLESDISELKARITQFEATIASKDTKLVEAQQRELSSFSQSEIESVRSEFEAKLESIEKQKQGLQCDMGKLIADRDSVMEQLRTELQTVNERVASTTAELDSLRARRDMDESRLQNELKKANELLNKTSEEKGTLQWQLDKEKEVSSRKVREMTEKQSQLEQLIVKRDDKISSLEQLLVTAKKAEEAAKVEVSRKLRIAEGKYLEAEELLSGLGKQLKESQESEAAMREEIELLIQQQSTAIDRVAASGSRRDRAEESAREAQEQLKQTTDRISSIEKQLKNAEAHVSQLKNEIEQKKHELAEREVQTTKCIEAEKQKTHNVAIITSVAVLVLSRLLFA